MNCRQALSLIATEREAPNEASVCADLESHLAVCGSCRRARSNLAALLGAWRAQASAVNAPDAGREWRELRRRHRGAGEVAVPLRGRGHRPFAWLSLTLAAAAAMALALFLPHTAPDPAIKTAFLPAVARVESVDVPGGNTSTMVFVDDQSGWLIVWASDAGGNAGQG